MFSYVNTNTSAQCMTARDSYWKIMYIFAIIERNLLKLVFNVQFHELHQYRFQVISFTNPLRLYMVFRYVKYGSAVN